MMPLKEPDREYWNEQVTIVVFMLITAHAMSFFYRFLPIMVRVVVVPAVLTGTYFLGKWVNKKWPIE
jgi:hypothetical protein